ncbi:MAG: polymorphic toxin-type HINT domain-containing protein, partial [Acidimicrobiales bacterium]
GGVCVDQMGDGRWIALMYAGRGVLTYQVFTSNPGSRTSPEAYYRRLYTSWQELLGGIAIALLAGMAMGGSGNSGGSGTGSGFGWGGSSCSFSANTVVWTPGGEVPIAQLQVDEQVLAYSPLTHLMEAQSILHVWEHEDTDLVDVSIMPSIQSAVLSTSTAEVIHTTSEHPFLTVEKGFIPVSQLKVGMHVIQANENVGIVTAIQPVSGHMVMYNLDVAQDHTFMVGDDQWIVHNKCFDGVA